MVQVNIENSRKKSIVGNIYVGKVQNVLVGLRSAFIDIGEGKNAFIHEKDLPQNINVQDESEIVPINKILKTGKNLWKKTL